MALEHEPQLPNTLPSPLEVLAWAVDRFEHAAILVDDSLESEVLVDMLSKVRRSVSIVRGAIDDHIDAFDALIIPSTSVSTAFAWQPVDDRRGVVHVAPLTGWDAERIAWWVDRYGIDTRSEAA